jgi:isopenicillin N synthase-like dioxygenase
MQIKLVDYQDRNAHKSFTESIRDTGFAVIHNHEISHALIDNVYNEWVDFFNLPESKKAEFLFERDYKLVQDGFFPKSISEVAKSHDKKDIKEFYHYSPKGRKLPSNIQYSQELYNQLIVLAEKLLEWLYNDLADSERQNLLSEPFHKIIDKEHQTILRSIHYPPVINDIEDGTMRSAPHEDINLITLLVAATEPGLEVKGNNDKWYQVPPIKSSIVVNAGDMLQELTNKYYKSTTHKVINPDGANAGKSRYSIPLFVHPKGETRLSTRYTARQYLDERLGQLGLLKA